MSHTPGPWRVEEWEYNNGHVLKLVVQNNNDAVAEVWGIYRPEDLGNEETKANANLIASAPCLLEALGDLLESINYECDCTHGHVCPMHGSADDAKRIIAKAKGE